MAALPKSGVWWLRTGKSCSNLCFCNLGRDRYMFSFIDKCRWKTPIFFLLQMKYMLIEAICKVQKSVNKKIKISCGITITVDILMRFLYVLTLPVAVDSSVCCCGTCVGIAWRSCENSDSDPEGVGGGQDPSCLRFRPCRSCWSGTHTPADGGESSGDRPRAAFPLRQRLGADPPPSPSLSVLICKRGLASTTGRLCKE